MKSPEQAENQPSAEDGRTSLAKLCLKEICLTLILPLVIIFIILIVTPFPLSSVIATGFLTFCGLLMVIFAAPYGRHIYKLALRTNKEVSKKASKILGVEVEEKFLNIFYLPTFLGVTFQIWWIRFIGAIIAGFFAYKLYTFVT